MFPCWCKQTHIHHTFTCCFGKSELRKVRFHRLLKVYEIPHLYRVQRLRDLSRFSVSPSWILEWPCVYSPLPHWSLHFPVLILCSNTDSLSLIESFAGYFWAWTASGLAPLPALWLLALLTHVMLMFCATIWRSFAVLNGTLEVDLNLIVSIRFNHVCI